MADEVRSAKALVDAVCAILDQLGLPYKTEAPSRLRSVIINKARRVDVAVVDGAGEAIMHIECKVQNQSGSAEDKLFRAVEEANRDKRLGMPSIIVFAGHGWTDHDLRYAMLNGAVRLEYLEAWLQTYFGYVRGGRKGGGEPRSGDGAGGARDGFLPFDAEG